MSAVYPLFQMLGAPLLGKWSDQYGRKRILLLSQLGTFISWLIFLIGLLIPTFNLFTIESHYFGSFIFSLPLVVLFFARAMDGLTGGNISVANAYLADISDDQNRKANFGKLSSSGNLGFIIGPMLAGFLGATILKEILPVFAAVLISLAAVLMIWWRLPETKCTPVENAPDQDDIRKVLGQEQNNCYTTEDKVQHSFFTLIKIKGVLFMLILYFFIFLGFNVFYSAFPIYAQLSLKWSAFELGIFYSFLSIFLILVQTFLLGFISKRSSDGFLVLTGSLILSSSFFLLMYHHFIASYAACFLFSLGTGIMWPAYLSLLSKAVDTNLQGYLQGVATSLGSFASIVGLIVGGILFEIFQSATFALAALMIFIVFILCFKFVLKKD